MYRLLLESLLGLRREEQSLHIDPCLPAEWQSFKLRYRYQQTDYQLVVKRATDAHSGSGVTVDGVQQDGLTIPLVDDRRPHAVEIIQPD